MSGIIYCKRYQRHGVYHYAKVWVERRPPSSEIINFLNTTPLLEHREYNLTAADDQQAFQALLELWDWIEEAEFKRAYQRATAGDFQMYVNGKRIDS